jgi:hypothetical protein
MDQRLTSPHARTVAAKIERVFLMARIGRVLRGLHDDVLSEPLPPKLESLVRRLKERAA